MRDESPSQHAVGLRSRAEPRVGEEFCGELRRSSEDSGSVPGHLSSRLGHVGVFGTWELKRGLCALG